MPDLHRLAPALQNMTGRSVRVRLRKGTITKTSAGFATCVLADGVTEVGVVPVKSYTPAIGDIVLIERVSAVTYALGAITPP